MKTKISSYMPVRSFIRRRKKKNKLTVKTKRSIKCRCYKILYTYNRDLLISYFILYTTYKVLRMIRKQSFVFIKNTYLSSSKECEGGDMLLFYILYFFFIKVSLFFFVKIWKYRKHNIILYIIIIIISLYEGYFIVAGIV